VQTLLGHSPIVMTLDVYGHLFRDGGDTRSGPDSTPARGILRWVADRTGSRNTLSSMQCPPDAAERRQVPVMFSDLVGSTVLPAFATRRGRGYEPGPGHATFGTPMNSS
jgi:hypothetical protein